MKTRKSIVRQVLACCLVLALALSMTVTGMAAITPDSTGTITVDGINDTTTVSAYQVITVNVNANGQPQEPMYYWVDAVRNWMTTNYPNYIDAATGAVTSSFDAETAVNTDTFWQEMAAAIKTGAITLTSTDVSAEEGQESVTFTDMPMGVYLMTATGGVKIYNPTTAQLIPEWDGESEDWILNNDSVTMKGEQPPIEKEGTTEDGDQSVAIGDTVSYQLKVGVPSYPADAVARKFVIGDTLSSGLTLNTSSITVYADEDLQTEIPMDGNYTLDTDTANHFEISFIDAFFDNDTYSALTYVYVTYTATVNENAFTTDALGNDAFLGYNNDPYDEDDYDTNETHEEVYTYGFDLTKVNKNDTATTLPGAEFTLAVQGSQDLIEVVDLGNGTYRVAKEDDQTTTTTLVTGQGGKLVVRGLDEGTYTLTETKAPDNYVMPSNPVTTIVLNDNDEEDGILDDSSATGSNVTVTDQTADNILEFQLGNTSEGDAGFELPETGGMGTVLFTVIGLAFMGGAVLLIVLASKKKKAA